MDSSKRLTQGTCGAQNFVECRSKASHQEISTAVQKAALLREAKEPDSALILLQPFQVLYPNHIGILSEIARCLREVGDFQASLPHLDALLIKQPNHKWALLAKVNTLIQAGRHMDAVDAIDKALTILPENVELLARKGAALRGLFHARAAVEFLTPLVSRYQSAAPLRHELSVALRDLGDFQASLLHLDTILTSQPEHKWALLAKAKTLIQAGQQFEAVDAINDALAVLPENIELLVLKGAALRQLYGASEAVAFLTPLVSRYKNAVQLHHELSIALREMGEFQASLRHINEILIIQPGHKLALLAKVKTLIQDGREDELMLLAEHLVMLKVDAPADRASALAEAALSSIKTMPSRIAEYLLENFAVTVAHCPERFSAIFLWNAYERAEYLGLGMHYQKAVEGLLCRSDCKAEHLIYIIKLLAKGGIRESERLAARLAGLLDDSERPLFYLKMGVVTGNSDSVLEGRLKDAHCRTAEEVRSIAQLLQQSGRLYTASRYLRIARRNHPKAVNLFQDYMFSLINSGQADAALAELKKVDLASPSMDRAWIIATARCWYELGCSDQTLHLIQSLPISRVINSHFQMQLRALIHLGRLVEANDLVMNELERYGANRNPHFFSTLTGQMAADFLLSTGRSSKVGLSTTPAIIAIEKWKSYKGSRDVRGNSQARPHDSVMQFWHKGTPPRYLREIMHSWQKVFGPRYRLFDRKSAVQFLNQHLGCDWAAALRNAASPAEESDYFRLCYLLVKGGVYADCDDWLVGDPSPLTNSGENLIVYQEPGAIIGNNVIAAPPEHPVIIWAAIAAKRSLEERDNDSTWSKTGPGLLTRAVAQHICRHHPGTHIDLVIEPRWKLGRFVQFHTPLPYKRSKSYWNSGGARRNFPVFMNAVGS